MSDADTAGGGAAARLRRWEYGLAAAALLAAAWLVWLYFFNFSHALGPAQPIPFSHRFHAGQKQIGCLFCHPQPLDARRAGIPPLQTCMLCHAQIIPEYPAIQVLRRHYAESRPVAWVRVNRLPEHVFFDHSAHLRKEIDCGACHGNVKEMDRVAPASDFNMGFCVQCHRDRQASVDCLRCHR